MGIKGLMKMIRHYAPDAVIEKEYASLSGSVVALDILLTMYKFIIAIRGNGGDIKTNDGKMKSHVYGLLYKIHNMLKYGILPVAVFDGKAPTIKKETIRDRCDRKKLAQKKLKFIENNSSNNSDEKIKFYKRSFNISEKHINDAKKMMELFGFLSIQAPEEADSQCAALNVSNFVDAVVTEDMDVLAFGTNKMLRKFSNKNKVVEIDLKNILTGMKLNKEQFIDICIILGTDYCKPIKGLNINSIYEIYTKCGNMYDFINELSKINVELVLTGKEPKYKIPKNFITRWRIAKEYYISSAFVIDPVELTNNKMKNSKSPQYWSKPNKEKLIKFLCADNDFDVHRVTQIIDYSIKRYTEYITNGHLSPDWTEINKSYCPKKHNSQNFVVLGKPYMVR